jgi:photosystem II stability/assembly factor-like uncharacterized protein
MKNNFSKLITVVTGACILGGGLLTVSTTKNPIVQKESMRESQEEGEEARGYLNWMREKYADPATGEYNVEAIAASRKALVDFRANEKNLRAFPTMSWQERGPNDVGGRTRQLLIDKTNPNKLYVAAAGGGIFVSTNAGDTWAPHPQSDTLPSMQGSSIAQSISGDIYFATGEGYSDNGRPLLEGGSALPGDGIFRSLDGGVTFTQLATTRPSANSSSGWAYIKKVACHPTDNNIIYAGTSGGLKKSVNQGNTWTNAPGVLASATITDVEIVPNGNMVVGTTAGVYISVNGGTSFTNVWGTGNLSGGLSRSELAFAPSNPNHLYLVAINGSSSLKGIYQSLDFGTTWSVLKSGGGSFEPFSTPPPTPINQGFWGVCLAVNPAIEDELYVGGMTDLYRFTPAQDFQSVAYSNGSVSSGIQVHADMHDITYDVVNPNIMYVSCDGGVYKTNNASATNPGFIEKNDGMNTLQALMFDANAFDKIISGSQDNGTSYIGDVSNSALSSREVNGGDGGICALSDIFPEVAFGSVSYNSDLDRSISTYHTFGSFNNKSVYNRNIDGGYQYDAILSKWVNTAASPNGRPDDQEVPANDGIWSIPMDFKEKTNGGKNYTVMVIGTANNLWFSQEAADPSKSIPNWFNLGITASSGTALNSIFNGKRFSAVHISKDGTTIYAATGVRFSTNNRVWRISGLDLFNKAYSYDSTGVFYNNQGIVAEDLGVSISGFITSLASDETDGEDLIITTSNYGGITNYVRKISNAKTGLAPRVATSIVNNLPPMPINSAVYVPGFGKNRIVLGTESGIWGSDNAGSTWQELNKMDPDPKKWHPRVPVTKVLIQNLISAKGPVLFSGTHGRGMFSCSSMATLFPTKITDITKNGNSLLYPNPATNSTTIALASNKASQAFVQIINMSGAVVNSFTTSIESGDNKIEVNTSKLSKGGYIVSIVANGERMVNTLIKE